MPVFQDAVELYVLANRLKARLGRRRRIEMDQLQRASLSGVLNIAEASGELAPRDKARIYRLAQRSTMECAAVLAALARVGPAVATECRKGRDRVIPISAQLTGLCRAMEKRAAQKRS